MNPAILRILALMKIRRMFAMQQLFLMVGIFKLCISHHINFKLKQKFTVAYPGF